MKFWRTSYQQVVRVFGNGYKCSMEENGTYGMVGVLWDYLWCVKIFSDGVGIDMADGDGGDRLCVRVEMWK